MTPIVNKKDFILNDLVTLAPIIFYYGCVSSCHYFSPISNRNLEEEVVESIGAANESLTGAKPRPPVVVDVTSAASTNWAEYG
jgi:hypothetical protein